MKQLPLEELIKKVKEKDEQAFLELYHRFYKKTYYAALKISGNQADAKDIAQETFIQVNKSINTLQDDALFVQWLNKIVISKASDLFRKNKTTSLPDDHALFQVQKEEHSAYIPEAKMHFESDQEMLNYFLSHMDEKYRMVLVMHYLCEMSITEIAEALQIPDGTVKTRLKRGREILKEMIEKYEKKENIALDFKSSGMGALLVAFFMQEFDMLQVEVPQWKRKKKTVKGRKLSDHLLSAIAVCLIGVLLYSGYQLYNYYQHRNTNMEMNAFGPITYQNIVYDNPEDAYYALTLFAHCEVEMKEKTEEELQSILPLYLELKRYEGVYWKLMNLRGWNIEFEKFIKN